MSKMYYFSNKFSNIAKRWGFPLFTFDIGDLKLRNFGHILFLFKLIMTKSNLQKSVMLSQQLRHRKTSPK